MINLGKIKISKSQILAILIGAILIALSFYLAIRVRFDVEDVQEFVFSFGLLGPVVFIFLYVLQQLISPLPGIPLILAGLALFGLGGTFVLVYLSSIIGAAANFGIARKWGRPAVKKLAGDW